ncbi:MAG: 3-dehydroquinate synthase [Bacteroidales bacterium]|jgi:3-dehydroquinate synthase|nr:3-dehydroquinate synthase [Bacteroidales bacterium]
MASFNTPIVPFEGLNLLLTKDYCDAKLVVLADENTRKYGLPHLLHVCPMLQNALIIEIPSGEKHKNLQTFSMIIERLSEYLADRTSLLINLGGGVICDMGGFAAACYKRGIDFVNIPTTLLAMVDAAYGGKTGVNFDHFKNQIGVFAPAKMIVIDVDFLQTLPKSELLSGFAEMIKMALITSVDFWDEIKAVDLMDFKTLKPLIIETIEKKRLVVEKDPTEEHSRKILNFGHTFGHAFETLALEQARELSHGHAVAMGMLCELWLSEQILKFDTEKRREVSEFIICNFPKYDIQPVDIPRLMDILLHDKKNVSNQIKPVLLNGIGNPVYDINCSKELCTKAFQTYIR